jgi:primase-polymerase (primpol)-like protein
MFTEKDGPQQPRQNEDRPVITLASLASLEIWVGWREEMVGGRLTKIPYDPKTGGRAASDNPRTWATHDEAQKWADRQRRQQQNAGIGIMLGPVDGVGVLCGIDLDTCRDKATGAIDSSAQEVIDRFRSYAEISPSGTGAHVLFRLDVADMTTVEAQFEGQFGRQFKRASPSGHPPAIEIYRGCRFFAVSWETISAEDEIRRNDVADLKWLIHEAGPKFAGKGDKDPSKDDSRSAKAFRTGAALKATGATYEKCATRCSAMRIPKSPPGRAPRGWPMANASSAASSTRPGNRGQP